MLDNDSTTYYTSATSQDNKSWIGVDLCSTTEITEVSILQGRNSVDDVDYFDNAIVEYSEDGENWTALTDTLRRQYVIDLERNSREGQVCPAEETSVDKKQPGCCTLVRHKSDKSRETEFPNRS